MSKKLQIVHIASEIEPFSKSGGLANVIGALPKAHKALGHDVIVIAPFYDGIVNQKGFNFEAVGMDTIGLSETVSKDVWYFKNEETGITVYFVSNNEYFGSKPSLYGSENENARFFFFDVAALQLLKKLDFKPDVIHCHDWHTGLIPYFLKGRYKKDPFWEKTATLYTIHNLGYQLGHDWWSIAPEDRDDGRSKLPLFSESKRLEKVNFAKRAIMFADAINTVSETYREEILTKDFGEELHRVLKNREKILFGIVNGIDYDAYNPLTDPGLYKHYSEKSVNLRKHNKHWLQKQYKLPLNDENPLFCATSRVVEQKGYRLISAILPALFRHGIQMIVMGDGDEKITNELRTLQKEFPKNLVVTPFDKDRETSLYAGADAFLLPSRFEPCGINQMIAMRYGCVPVVHHIGGLADTIVDYDPRRKDGNGFTFDRYTSRELLIAMVRVMVNFKHKRAWKELVIRDMREANSWLLPAEKYIDLYETTMRLSKRNKKNGNGNSNGH